MKQESQVSNKELSIKLRDLGVPQESLFYWVEYDDEIRIAGNKKDIGFLVYEFSKDEYVFNSGYDSQEGVKIIASAFTVAELGEMLPCQIGNGDQFLYIWKDDENWWRVTYTKWGTVKQYEIPKQPTEADARAEMLVYLLENKLIKL